MIVNYKRLETPLPTEPGQGINNDYIEIRDSLKSRLLATAELSADLVQLKSMAALRDVPTPEKMLPNEFITVLKELKFGFKSDKDPANLFPLRTIETTSSRGENYAIGAETKNSDVTVSDQTLDLFDIEAILELTTYFSTVRKVNDTKKYERYGVRIIALAVKYLNKAKEEKGLLISSGKGVFANIGATDAYDTIKLNVRNAVETYNENRSNDYVISQDLNESGISLAGTGTKGDVLTNIRYATFVGDSRSYIANFTLVTSIDVTNNMKIMFANLEKLRFLIPYRKNPTGLDITNTFETASSDKGGNIEIYQRSTSRTISIPSVGVADVVEIGSPYSNTKTTTRTSQSEKSHTDERRNNIAVPVSATSYVANDFPTSPVSGANVTVKFGYLTGKNGIQITIENNGAPAGSVTILRREATLDVEAPVGLAGDKVFLGGLGAKDGTTGVYPGGAGQPEDFRSFAALGDVPVKVDKGTGGARFKMKIEPEAGRSAEFRINYDLQKEAIELDENRKTSGNYVFQAVNYFENGDLIESRYSLSIPLNSPAFNLNSEIDPPINQQKVNKAVVETILDFV
ncbi:hypothetical protein [Roseibium algae]|uniref:Uncharacterized protein n=1 Tax=Roseibium algae TaxID=3123038 RepID=A0ABU8TJM0_9HYPH